MCNTQGTTANYGGGWDGMISTLVRHAEDLKMDPPVENLTVVIHVLLSYEMRQNLFHGPTIKLSLYKTHT